MADCATGILIDLNEEEKKKASVEVAFELPPLRFDVDDVCRTPEPRRTPENKREKNIVNVDDLLKEDVKLIDSEEFNFDLLMSPCSEQHQSEDEDNDEEVFFGPVQGFSEICAAVSATAKSESEEVKPLSPLNPKQVAELFTEAHSLAFRIENSKTDSPDAKVDALARKLRKTRITRPVEKKTPASPVKSPSADSGVADTSASSHEDRSESDPPRFSLDYKTPEKIVTQGCKMAETRVENITLPKVELPRTETGAAKFRSKNERGLEGLKATKVSKTGLRVPTSNNAVKPAPSRLVRGGSFRQKPVTSPMKRQRKNSLGSDIETASMRSDLSDSMSSLTGLPMAGKRSLAQPRQQANGQPKQGGLRLPKPKTRTLSNSSAGSSCSTSSQVSNCSQTSTASLTSLRVPRTKMQLKPAAAGPGGALKVASKTLERKPAPGPLKARPPSPAPGGDKSRQDVVGKENKPCGMKPPDARAPRPRANAGSTGSTGSIGSTPTPQKPDKHVQPKRLLSAGAPCTPSKDSATPSTPKSVTDSASKRRSFLPTPSSLRANNVKPSPLSARKSNQGSSEGDTSPVLSNSRKSGLTTPSVTKHPNRRVLHTPLQGAEVKPPKPPSRWSPLKKQKPINKEDEYYQCTKRGQSLI